MQYCVVAALFTYTVCENKFKYKLGKKKTTVDKDHVAQKLKNSLQ